MLQMDPKHTAQTRLFLALKGGCCWQAGFLGTFKVTVPSIL